MHETPDDLESLQQLLDGSIAAAGPHLRSIITPPRRLSAGELCARLRGMTLLALATVTADGRPLVGPVDGVFYRGRFHFGTSPDAVRYRHVMARPHVSATHVPSEQLAVTVHGAAVELDMRAAAEAGLRATLLEVYTPRYGPQWEEFLDSGPVYFRIEPERMFTFHSAA